MCAYGFTHGGAGVFGGCASCVFAIMADIEPLSCMPFRGLTNYQLYVELQSAKSRYADLFLENGLLDALKDSLADEITSTFQCKYYDEESFFTQFSRQCTNEDTFSSLHINLQSSLKNLYLLKANLETLKYDFSIIGITESGNRTQHQLDDAFLGYDSYYSPPVSHKGGVVVYVLKELFSSVKIRSDLSISSPEIESLCLEMEDNNNDKYVCCTIYRHPNTNYDQFETYINRVIDTLQKENITFFIQGDINIDMLKPENTATSRYLDSILPNNIIPCITKPTRITESSATLIDHMNVFRPLNQLCRYINAGCLLLDISDHLATFFILDNVKISKRSPQVRPKIRIFSEENVNNFKNEISNNSWDDVLNTATCDQAFSTFHDTFLSAYNKWFPLTTMSRKRMKDKPWLTKEIRQQIRYKNILFRKYLKKPGDIQLHNRLKTCRRTLNTNIREAKSSFYRNKLTSEKAKIKDIWKLYGDLMGKNRKKSDKIDHLTSNNVNYSDDKAIADIFNSFFATVGSDLAKTFNQGESYKDYLTNDIQSSMYIPPTEKVELLTLLKGLDKKKASGMDGISPSIVCQVADSIVDPLVHISNLSFEQGVFPSKLKISKVIPLYKKSERSDPSNYRPISLLSIFSKIIEKLMHKRLYSYLTKYNILFDLQFGFRENHSTVLALIEIIDSIRKELDGGNSVVGIYLDLSKAFDTVNHQILLDKLSNYGIRGNANRWFKSYLSNRTQITSVNGVFSDEMNVSYGVPQGSVLGPLLFLIYVNDIAHVLPENNTRLFADDTNIFITGDNIITLKQRSQFALQSLYKWFCDNQLSLNISKTCFTLFSKKLSTSDLKISLNNVNVPCVDHTKYLGVYLDKDLSFKKHTEYVKGKLTKMTGLFYYMSDFLHPADILRIYFAYVFPHLKYGIEVYGMSSKSNIKCLQGIQNKLVKLLCKSDMLDSPQILLQDLKIFNVQQIIYYFLLCFVYKQINHMLPSAFSDYFVRNCDLNIRCHRSENDLNVPFFRLQFGRKSIKCIGSQLYNNLPSSVKESASFEIFKRSLKSALINGDISALI